MGLAGRLPLFLGWTAAYWFCCQGAFRVRLAVELPPDCAPVGDVWSIFWHCDFPPAGVSQDPLCRCGPRGCVCVPPFLIEIAPCEMLTPDDPPNVAVPVTAGAEMVGEVSVLLVSVSVVVRPTSVSVVAGIVSVMLPEKAEWAGA